MNDVTRILAKIARGEEAASEELLPLVYQELRQMAAARLTHEQSGQTLQATALVHEAYLRLIGNDAEQKWDSQGHFFAVAAEAMRRVLIENARRKGRHKHGGEWRRLDFENLDPIASVTSEQLLAMDEALVRLEEEEQLAAKLVNLRYFAGLSLGQATLALGISTATAYRHWAFARAFLRCEVLDDAR